MIRIVIVNASSVLSDEEAFAIVPALQVWDDTMLRPAWGFEPCTYSFWSWNAWQTSKKDPNVWAIFLNNHSTDPGVGGYHDDQDGLIYGRIFVGDCLRYGISWTVDCSHEAAEMRGDPTINRTFTMADGRLAMHELCDAVEDDALAIDVNGVKLSDFVLPAYFSAADAGPYDYGNHLSGVCPALTTGGYMSIYDGTSWSQVTAMYLGGGPSYRSQRYHHGDRRMRRAVSGA